MPNRIIREGINSSSRINALSFGAEVLYRRLMSVADDYGRYYADPAAVRGACWPTASSKVTEKQVMAWMQELSAGPEPLVLLYQAKGCQFLQIQGFGQQIRSKSKFPEHDSNLQPSREQPDTQLLRTSRSRSRYSESETESETHTSANADLFERLYESYPRKKSKATAERAFEKAVQKHFAGDEEKALATMLDALKRLETEWAHRPLDKVPYPATWLNAQGWLDEATEIEQTKDDKCPDCRQAWRVHLPLPGANGKHCPQWAERGVLVSA